MLMEELFARGIMTMGPSRVDPGRQVGVFTADALSAMSEVRKAEMERVRWLEGEWNYENLVPATRLSPAYTDVGTCRFRLSEKDTWICAIGPGGQEIRNITFDPLSRQWIYVLTQGSYGLLRSPEAWTDGRIVFTGSMLMLGIDCQWRMSWTKKSANEFGFVNEEFAGGSWHYIDEWQLVRKE